MAKKTATLELPVEQADRAGPEERTEKVETPVQREVEIGTKVMYWLDEYMGELKDGYFGFVIGKAWRSDGKYPLIYFKPGMMMPIATNSTLADRPTKGCFTVID